MAVSFLAFLDNAASSGDLLSFLSARGLHALPVVPGIVRIAGSNSLSEEVAQQPGVVGTITPDVIGSLNIGPNVFSSFGEAAQALAPLEFLLPVALDETAVAGILGWVQTLSPEFDRRKAERPKEGQNWNTPGGCVVGGTPSPEPAGPLRSLRFAGDPILEACLAGNHRMREPEESDAVGKVQQALLDLGYSLPVHGADGRFGSETGAAVVAFKRDHDLHPTDPVVGPGTTRALDEMFADE